MDSPPSSACPGCGERSLRPLLALPPCPVMSVRLVESREDALAYPTGGLELHVCGRCGLIHNAAFEPERVSYDPAYEEVQTWSGIFLEAQADWIAHLAGHVPPGGHVLEIGCGKGAFLAELCVAASCRGTGYDPAFRPGAVTIPDGIEIRPHVFAGGEPADPVDLVVCRMTLEHVGRPHPLLEAAAGLLRTTGRPGALLWIQVPNADRILAQRAYWDFYYEHVLYFTRRALERLLVRAGFAVLSIEPVFDEQYLVAEARLDPGAPVESSSADPRPAADSFAEEWREWRDAWRSTIETERTHEKPVVLWGGGSKAVAFLAQTGVAPWVDAVVDINPVRQGTFLAGSGLRILAPEELIPLRPALVIVMNAAYLGEIRTSLRSLGLDPTLRTLDTQ